VISFVKEPHPCSIHIQYHEHNKANKCVNYGHILYNKPGDAVVSTLKINIKDSNVRLIPLGTRIC